MSETLTWKDLAKKLNTTGQSLNAWKRLDGAPNEPDVEQWKAFRSQRLLGKDTATKTLADLKAELMREQIELARSKNKRESAEVIDREVVEAMLVTLGQKLDLLLRLKLEVELGPRVVGKNAAEANLEGSVILDEIREVIEGNIAKFEGEALDRSRDGEKIV
jgi:hypothetical protein